EAVSGPFVWFGDPAERPELLLPVSWQRRVTDRAQEGSTVSTSHAGETLTLADDLTISRMGYGAMQLAGPGVFRPPKDRDEAIAVLRGAVDLGITHIDTSDYYGPYIVNELIKEALYPYPEDLR